MTRLLLNMIVRNEAANLPRFLKSVEPHIMGAAITDTGSTDDTISVIEAFFTKHNKPLWVNHAPFEDFSQARNAALRHARSLDGWDYILLGDADMELAVTGKIPKLTAATYALMQDNGRTQWWNIRLLRNDVSTEYEGKTHEKFVPDPPPTAIGGLWYIDHETGSNRGEKFTRDIHLLSDELRDDPTNARSMFYMVQSLYGAGMVERAREFCDYKLTAGGLEEEIFWTMLHAAQFDEQLKREPATIIHEYLAAYERRPTRAEPLCYLAQYLASIGRHRLGLLYAREAALMHRVMDILPVDLACYEWAALDIWMVCANECGSVADTKAAARILIKRKLPDAERERIMGNCNRVLNPKKGRQHEKSLGL
jgi:glycosyltransferase involved in cell wall biosynthesis